MSNQGFTPGPWVIEKAADAYCIASVGNLLIMPSSGKVKHDNTEADASLIAAAPELLAALEAVDREHDLLLAMKSCIASRPQGVISIAVDDDEDAIAWRGYRDEAQKLVDARRAAIAKALGTPC